MSDGNGYVFAASLTKWTEARRALLSDPSVVDNWKPADWAAYRTLVQEFGGSWTKDPAERKRREMLVQDKMRSLPRRIENGSEYDPAYSLGMHLAALKADRDEHPGLYQDLPEDDTMERYELLKKRRKR